MRKLAGLLAFVFCVGVTAPAMATPVALIWGFGFLAGTVEAVNLKNTIGTKPVAYPRVQSGADGVNTCYEPSQYIDRCSQPQAVNPNIQR